MKTLEELKKIRDEAAKKMTLRNEKNGYRVLVGMATCGISAGARPVLNTLVEEVSRRNLSEVMVSQVGCIGECALEPIVEVFDPKGVRYTYCKVDPEKAKKILDEHVVKGHVLEEYLIQNYKK